MAERSFAREIAHLELGAGQEFRGEAILAVTKALLESGVAYVAGYQGAPISHLMDVLTEANPLLERLGVRFMNSANEAAAAAALAASVHYPLRGAATFKGPVGVNVASDALANLSSGGVTGGALVIVGEDYGEGSSIMQERSHAFAMKSQMWLLDPRPNLPSIVRAVKDGFRLSEASNTPVMLGLRIRACHVHGRFAASDNLRPPMTAADALRAPTRLPGRIVLPPASYAHERDKVEHRWPSAVRFIEENGLNEVLPGDGRDVGIIVQGGLANAALRALATLDLADAFGRTQVPVLVLNVTYPLADAEVARFCTGKRAVLVVEEGQPEFIEQAVQTALHRAGQAVAVRGKDVLPRAGEYTVEVLLEGFRRFLDIPSARSATPSATPPASAARGIASPDARAATGAPASPVAVPAAVEAARAAVAPHVRARPPGFCTGCPERPIFTAMKLLERELGPRHVSCDIGCHLFSTLPPFNVGHTTMGYGLGGAGAAAFAGPTDAPRPVAVIGDGGFWHNGLVSSVGDAVFNKADVVHLVVDNGYSAATGGQDILSSSAWVPGRSTRNPIARAARGVGAAWVRTVSRTYDLSRMTAVLRDALTTRAPGPKVVIARSECMLNRQRRERPQRNRMLKEGKRVVQERFGVDGDTCTGDHSCIRLSGCPSLTIAPNPGPLRRRPVVKVETSCVGCGLCGEVAHAAKLCPSFYRATLVSNPTRWERWRDRVRTRVIGALQRRLPRAAA